MTVSTFHLERALSLPTVEELLRWVHSVDHPQSSRAHGG